MSHGRRFTMKSSAATRSCHAWSYVLVAVVVIQVLGFSYAMPYGSGQQTIRLCSKSLSDALFLICQGRGYNSPFSYSGEDELRTTSTTGPGLVDECCLQSCSIKQLEMYCKPTSDESNSQDGMWVRAFLFSSFSHPIHLGSFFTIFFHRGFVNFIWNFELSALIYTKFRSSFYFLSLIVKFTLLCSLFYTLDLEWTFLLNVCFI